MKAMILKQNDMLLFDNKPLKDRFGGFLYSITTDFLNRPVAHVGEK